MENLVLIITVLSFGLVTAQEQAIITPNTQQVTWQGKAAVGGYAPMGTLDIKSATLNFTEQRIDALEIIIDMASLQQENKQLEGHLREKDFFHVNKYPTAVFTLNEPFEVTSQEITLTGTMTLKKEAIVENIVAQIAKEGNKIFIHFDHTMDRTEYGITYNSLSFFKKLKENAIADQFTIKGELVFEIAAEN